MKTKIVSSLLFVSAFFTSITASAQTRTGSIGYMTNQPAILTTNKSYTTTKVVENGVVVKETTVENGTVISTEPVQKRTPCEKLFGFRPFEHRVVPAGPGGYNEYPNRRVTPRLLPGAYGARDFSYGANVNYYGGYGSGGGGGSYARIVHKPADTFSAPVRRSRGGGTYARIVHKPAR